MKHLVQFKFPPMVTLINKGHADHQEGMIEQYKVKTKFSLDSFCTGWMRDDSC
jgi:hypothetical protein